METGIEVSCVTDWNEYHRRLYHVHRRRQMLYVTKGADPQCAYCGSVDDLEFDHIDPSQKSFNVGTRNSLNDPVVRAEFDKCQLLCRSCHEDKTASENTGFAHGSTTGFMRKKCECPECSEARRRWNDRRNAKRRADTVARMESGNGTADNVRGPYNRPSTHGDVLHYRRGCRCDLCREAKTKHERERRQAKRALASA